MDRASSQHRRAPADSWAWTPGVDADVLSKLEIRETSEGIVRTQRANREGWWAHAARNRRFIVDAIGACRGRELAVVLGAGQVFDLPIRELAQTFRRLIFVDIDGAALAAATASLPDDAPRSPIETVAMDVTGINQTLVHRVDALLDDATDVAAAESALSRLVASYQLAATPMLVPQGARADLIVSTCLLSQLAWSQQRYARRAYERRFGAAPSTAAWTDAWRSFEIDVQQDHIDALPALADVAVLTSDTAMHTTAVDAATGALGRTGAPQLPLHTRSLRERVAPPTIVDARATWLWELRQPEPRRGWLGLTCDVEALRLRRA